ncbi:VOC family protein [Solibacillus sp. FSL H8-0538]|uniref:VOC family protein n=1 Tax=Solibacillus sp. FSL H8-0538 TaxID=2921400 RepID=UPI0030FB93DB
MKSVRTFLMFQGNADQAIQQYEAWFPACIVVHKAYQEDNKLIAMAVLNINGYEILINDSSIQHGFTFTPSTSLFIECDSEEEIQDLTEKLTQDGEILMPLDHYGFSKKFAWIQDRFGVSWQLNLA